MLNPVNQDLMVFVSQTEIAPNEEKFDAKFDCPSCITVESDNKKEKNFQTFNIYLSFYS